VKVENDINVKVESFVCPEEIVGDDQGKTSQRVG
jgi:hypothetical protein